MDIKLNHILKKCRFVHEYESSKNECFYAVDS